MAPPNERLPSARLTRLSGETCSYYCGCLPVSETQTAQNKATLGRIVKKGLRPNPPPLFSSLLALCGTNMKEGEEGINVLTPNKKKLKVMFDMLV